MSYDKAMRHVRNPKKGRSQYMGFDTGSSWPNVRRNPYMAALLEVREWFKTRHVGDRQFNRECIKEAIQECRRQQRILTDLNKVDSSKEHIPKTT